MGKMCNYFMAKKEGADEDWGEKSFSLSISCSSSVFTGFVIPFGRHCLIIKPGADCCSFCCFSFLATQVMRLFILLFHFCCIAGRLFTIPYL